MEPSADTAQPRRVRRIVKVVDTRQYEEQGDRWVPIPGSGNAHECAFCGRLHEVHAEVELEDGAVAVIGTGCAGRGWEREMRRGSSAAARVAHLTRAVAKLRAALEAVTAEDAAAALLPLPAARLVEVREDAYYPGRRVEIWGMGDETVWCMGAFDAERRDLLERLWRRSMRSPATANLEASTLRCRVADAERLLARAVRAAGTISGA